MPGWRLFSPAQEGSTDPTETSWNFCVRAGLKDGDGTLVGFREAVVKAKFSIKNGFTSDTYSLTNAAASVVDEEDTVAPRLEVCAPGGNVPTLPLNQIDQPACLQVFADNTEWKVQLLKNVRIESADTVGGMGQIIDNNGVQVPNNGQALVINVAGGGQQIQWLFDAKYSTRAGTTAFVRGTAVFEPAARRLGGNKRALAENKETGFDATIEIAPNASSGGYDIKVTSFVLAGAAGAALFL